MFISIKIRTPYRSEVTIPPNTIGGIYLVNKKLSYYNIYIYFYIITCEIILISRNIFILYIYRIYFDDNT